MRALAPKWVTGLLSSTPNVKVVTAGVGKTGSKPMRLDGPRAVWRTSFTVISMISTTGYVNADEIAGLGLPVLFFAVLIIIGGTTGSTAGGMKFLRAAVLFKQAKRELARLSHPHGVLPLALGEQRLGRGEQIALAALCGRGGRCVLRHRVCLDRAERKR